MPNDTTPAPIGADALRVAHAAAVADAVAAERERCAQVCDRVALAWDGEEAPDGGYVAKQCSDAIREGQEYFGSGTEGSPAAQGQARAVTRRS